MTRPKRSTLVRWARDEKAIDRERHALRADVRDMHADAPADERDAHEEALGTDSDDQGLARWSGSEAPERGLDDSQGLDADEVVRGDGPDGPCQLRGDREHLRQRARSVHADGTPISARRGPAERARPTGPTWLIWLDDDQLADAGGIDALADSLDGPECLVAHDPGIARGWPTAAVHAQVGPAEPDASDEDADVPGPDFRDRDLVDDDAPGLDEEGR